MTAPVGGFVQLLAAADLPEKFETKRRLKNQMDGIGLLSDLYMQSAKPTTFEDLIRVDPETHLSEFKSLSDAKGGELGLRTLL